MAQGLSRADRRRGTKNNVYLGGKVDGAKILLDRLREASTTHPYECDCQSCQLLWYIAGGPWPDWAHPEPNIA